MYHSVFQGDTTKFQCDITTKSSKGYPFIPEWNQLDLQSEIP